MQYRFHVILIIYEPIDRCSHAQYSLGKFHDSVTSYTKGLALDPNNAVMKSALAQAQLKAKEQGDVDDEDEEADDADAPVGARGGAGAGAGGMPDLSSLAGMFGGGGGGGGGGMPDIASLMQNPQMMAMAQQMMANGGLDRLMQNPNIRNMVSSRNICRSA